MHRHLSNPSCVLQPLRRRRWPLSEPFAEAGPPQLAAAAQRTAGSSTSLRPGASPRSRDAFGREAAHVLHHLWISPGSTPLTTGCAALASKYSTRAPSSILLRTAVSSSWTACDHACDGRCPSWAMMPATHLCSGGDACDGGDTFSVIDTIRRRFYPASTRPGSLNP